MAQYTVKKLAELAGVTNRTLHYYDQIGLLQPAALGENGYRYYDEQAMLRLQQILFFREMSFSLDEIKSILDQPDFDLVHALQVHRKALLKQIDRLKTLVETVDNTIAHIEGGRKMDEKDFYAGFDEAQQEAYAREAEQRWGETAASSQKRWNAYSREEKDRILGQMHAISTGIAENMDKGFDSPEVQDWIDRWYQHINQYFYDCSLEVFEALGQMYTEDPRFRETYEKQRPGMAAFMAQAMSHYCQVRRS